jgi:hypothetical protein
MYEQSDENGRQTYAICLLYSFPVVMKSRQGYFNNR